MMDWEAHEVFDDLEVLICGLEGSGTIRVFNRPCERLTGIAREEAIGSSWLELFAQDARSDHVQTLWLEARDRGPAGPYESLCRNNRNLRWHFSRHPGGLPFPVELWAVGVDVTDEREALARARALEREVVLANLISGLAHEIRNPLNGALLQLALADRTLARHGEDWSAPIAVAVAQAAGEMRRMARILEDLLAFARPEPIRFERCDLRKVALCAIDRSAPRARSAGVTVVLEPGSEIVAEVDGGRLETAIYQLIANAIDASTGPDPVVDVRVVPTGNTVGIEVEDRGAGVSPSDATLFEPFFTTKQGGTGLGLSIVQRVATDHGGTIVHLRRDHATVFRLDVPIVRGTIEYDAASTAR